MKKTILGIILSISTFSSSAQTSTLNEYLKNREDVRLGRADKELATLREVYMNGLANGFNYANVFEQEINKSPLFCLPGKLILNGDMLDITIQSFLQGKDGEKLKNSLGEYPVEMIALKALMVVYSCK
ncbi:hypothetical protein [Nissabacter archeti]|jgi:hypothetical protein|uniref:hypothetical protein n=1 Tax=Nissabacter archeti TaxID=1917880 RepID=UPI0011154556|nr:hypothetical protein [Nissabacter archeti]